MTTPPHVKTPRNTGLKLPDTSKSPTLFPVVSMVTGTTPNGGGIWKYVLHGHEHGLMRRNRPVMMQALHFLDFGLSANALTKWRREPLRKHYNDRHENLKYTGAIFADSGGFTLMFDPELDLTKYGMPADTLAQSILELQLDYGANFVASLDYPIPPGLAPEEAERRQELSLTAAVSTARAIQNRPNKRVKPKFFVPIHGQSPDDLERYVAKLLGELDREGLLQTVHGLALGSMVPRRKNGQHGEVIEFTKAAIRAAGSLPLHVFGVTGSLMPHLVQQGVSSFDTSTYIQAARTLKYFDPETRRSLKWKHLPAYPCKCRVCANRNIEDDHAVMNGSKEGSKSMVYAAIALHNLEVEDQLLRKVTRARNAGTLDKLIEELPQQYPGMRIPKSLTPSVVKPGVKAHNRSDYDVRMRRWNPSTDARILLLLPCSQEKPYTSSQSYKRVSKYLKQQLGDEALKSLDIVFVSGLYGPVPMRDTNEEAILTYDFLLHNRNSAGIGALTTRLDAFIKTHGAKYEGVIAYINLVAYRKVLKAVQHHNQERNIQLLPQQGRMGQAAFYHKENLEALANAIKDILSVVTENAGSEVAAD